MYEYRNKMSISYKINDVAYTLCDVITHIPDVLRNSSPLLNIV